MTPEDPFDLGSYPQPPREPRWRACLAHRWVLGLLGGLLLCFGLLAAGILWASTGIGRPFDDAALDSGPSVTDGVVLEARLATDDLADDWIYEARYRFDVAGHSHEGRCFVDRQLAAGNDVRVEFLAGDPSVNRITGGFLTRDAGVVRWVLLLMVAPGILMLAVWLRGATRVRMLLRDGRLVAAELLERRPLPAISTPRIRLRYRYRDESGTRHEGATTVRRHGALGERIAADQPTHVAVAHDTGDPSWSRAVHPADFMPTTGGPGS